MVPSLHMTRNALERGAFIPLPYVAHQWDLTDNIAVTIPSWHPVMSGNNSNKTEKERVAKNPVSMGSLASKDRW